MERLYAFANDTFNYVISPASEEITRALISKFNLTQLFDNRIRFRSYGEDSSTSQDNDGNAQLLDNNVMVEITYTSDQKSQDKESTGNVNKIFQTQSELLRPLIFIDSSYDSEIRILPHNHMVTLNMEMTFRSKQVADKALISMRQLLTFDQPHMLIDLCLSTPIPPDVINPIFGCYMNNPDAVASEFNEYLHDKSNGIIGVSESRYTGKKLMVARFNHYEVYVNVELPEVPEAMKQGVSPDGHKLTITLTYQIGVPGAFSVLYPLIAHNKLIPKEYMPPVKCKPFSFNHPWFSKELLELTAGYIYPSDKKTMEAKKKLDEAILKLIDTTPRDIDGDDGWRIPLDSQTRLDYYEPLMSKKCEVAVNNSILIDTLAVFPYLPRRYRECIEYNGDKVLRRGESVRVTLYEDDTEVSPENIRLSLGVLRYDGADPDKTYRVVLSLYVGAQKRKLVEIEEFGAPKPRPKVPEVAPEVLHIPSYDSWMPPNDCRHVLNGYVPIVSMLWTLDDAETTDVDFLNVVPNLLDPIKELMIACGDKMFSVTELVAIAVFANDTQIEPTNNLELGSDMILKIKNKDTSKVYRVVLFENREKENGISYRQLERDFGPRSVVARGREKIEWA